MASTLRHPPDEPPALHDRAIQDLSFIRRTMEGASSFTDVPGWGLVLIGVTAIATALLADRQPTVGRWLGVWLLEAGLGALIGAVAIWRKIRRRARSSTAPLLSVPARKFLFGFWPGMLAGAVLTYALVDPRALSQPVSTLPQALPGVWLLLYGVSVTTAGAFSVRAVPLMGIGFMTLGAMTLVIRSTSGAVMLAAGFGVWQIAFGLWIARRHGG